ncbi:hypothetical protein [Pseudonocardia sp.]|uniref:hypothetical protein n=1 Tax=Pseudonocardia sp. TaxID=60912 RepID=UPI00261C3D67|nr:hypothetical protein [Pseudonocardia sp.]
MVERRLHVIGSYPAATAPEAMREMLARAAPHLAYLPDGETGERRDWIVHIINGLREYPDLVVRKEGDWSDYGNQLNFAVRRGHRLSGDTLDFGHSTAHAAARPAFEELRAEHGRPDLPFQVGIPGDLDMAMFTLGPTGPFTHRRPFTEAALREIARIHAAAGDDVVFQLEVPAEQVFVAMAPGPLRTAVARWAGSGVAALARRSPAGARFGIHLCLGDLGHKALTRTGDASPAVRLANAIARSWPAGRPLEFVHAPLAAGDEPPSLDPAFYAPLAALRLPVGTRFVAGLLHEARSTEELRGVLAAIEAAVGHPVDVAASCGYGRRSVQDAQRTLDQGVALCAS